VAHNPLNAAFLSQLNKIFLGELTDSFMADIKGINYDSPVTKFNIAVDRLPSFLCSPNKDETPQPHHFTTIHMNCESMAGIVKKLKIFLLFIFMIILTTFIKNNFFTAN
jgi:hypothetical protein